jgi:hypothetical protein
MKQVWEPTHCKEGCMAIDNGSIRGQDLLPGLILESFDAALLAADYIIALRILKTLETYLLGDETSPARRRDAVMLLADAHHRLLDRQIACNPALYPVAPAWYAPTRH